VSIDQNTSSTSSLSSRWRSLATCSAEPVSGVRRREARR
jgi:hypothetical protein